MLPNKYDSHIKAKDYLAQNPYLRYLFLELTTQCNLKCRHCGSKCPSQEKAPPIDTALLLRTIDDVADHVKPGTMMFCITGGEPLLRPDWHMICKHIASKGFSWGMTTNGTLITPQIVELMVEAGMRTVSVSVDGLQESHEWLRRVEGCFLKAINGVRLLVESKAFQCVQVTTVVNTRNLQELPALQTYLENLGVDSWKITATEPIGEANGQEELFLTETQYRYLLDFIKQAREQSKMEVTYGCSHFLPEEYETSVRGQHFYCGAGTIVASISAQGEILACLDIEERELTRQGNIRSDHFCDVWRNGFTMFRQPRNLEKAACASCSDKDFCRGDSWHTWDFALEKPRICLRKMQERKE